MILVYLVFVVISAQFRTFNNFILILRQAATLAIMGAGMTYVIIGGSFDLSVGSLLSLCSVVCISLHDSIGPVPAMIITILVGCASGILSGYLVGYLKLNSMIVTLGMMNVLQAAALMWTNGKFVELRDSNAWFTKLGKGSIGPIPVSTVIMIIFVIIMATLLMKTVYGHQIMAVGGNDEACRYSGINSKMVVLKSFVISGFCTAIGAMLLCSRGAAAQPTLGESYEFDVIAGVILGGASLNGGSGNVYSSQPHRGTGMRTGRLHWNSSGNYRSFAGWHPGGMYQRSPGGLCEKQRICGYTGHDAGMPGCGIPVS